MSPASHLFISWITANSLRLERRDRILVTLAGIAPDIDGLTVIPDLLTAGSANPLHWFGKYHHVLAHNLGFGLVLVMVCAISAKRRLTTAFLAATAFHLHLVCDIIGSRGPEGYQWPIPYLLPFSDKWQIIWDGQWALNAWPNFAITALAMGLSIVIATCLGRSPLEMVSLKWDQAVVQTLQRRFKIKASDSARQ